MFVKQIRILLVLAAVGMALTSCGSFGEGMLMGLANATSSMGGYGYTPTSSYTPTTSYVPTTTSASSGNLDYLLDPRYAIAQVQAQEEAEYQQAAAGFAQMGKTLTRQEYMAMKGAAIQQMNSSGGSGSSGGTSYSSHSGSSSSSRSSSSGSSVREHCTMSHVHDYMHCNGTGRCQRCNGRGRYTDSMFGQTVTHDPCNYCHGTGKCPSCHGTGYK